MGLVSSLLIALPPLEEQKRIADKAKQLMVLCDELEAKQEKQTHTRRQLSDAALNALLSAASPDKFEKHWQRIVDNFDLIYNNPENLHSLRQSIWQLAIQGKLTASWRMKNQILINGENHPKKILEKIRSEKEKQTLDGKIKGENLQGGTYVSKIIAPSDWVLCNLVDLSKQITDGTHQTPTYVESGKIFLSAQNVKPFRFITDNHRFVSKVTFEKIRKNRIPEKGDLIVARVGAGIGEAAVIDQDIEFAFYVSMGLIKVFNKYVNTRYLAIVFNSPYGVSYSKGNISGDGTSAGNFNLGKIRSFNIPLPSTAEQNAIVEKVDRLMTACDELEKRLTSKSIHLEKLTDSLIRI